MQEVPVAVLKGRAHYYEGFERHGVTFPTRVLAALGTSELLAAQKTKYQVLYREIWREPV